MNAPPSIRVHRRADLPAALERLGLLLDVPVLSVVGGADGISPPDLDVVSSLLEAVIVPLLGECGATVVYGGTDSGVMRVVGRVRPDGGFPLVGVAAAGTIDGIELEPNHTHFVVVPGTRWGDESPWLFDVAAGIAGTRTSATVVVNGGEITLGDMEHSLARRIPVLVLAGTGRAADRVAAGAGDDRIRRIAKSPLTYVADVHDRDAVRNRLKSLLLR
ncbi:hypothetical protein AB5J62_19980 [Amycolatopsis sp. cg5]|uniref:hypothetical protein n=1 Tax=Amycolatopsis sp. cg5 TaxID=3238802 RepID=UPI0035240A80